MLHSVPFQYAAVVWFIPAQNVVAVHESALEANSGAIGTVLCLHSEPFHLSLKFSVAGLIDMQKLDELQERL